MKKVIILVISGFILLAIVIRCVSGGGSDYDEDDEMVGFMGTVSEEDPNPPKQGGAIDIYNDNVTFSEVLHDDDLLGYEVPQLTRTKPEQIMKRKGYITSYNQATRNANWVAWHMTRETENGPWKREGLTYYEDDEVQGGRQETSDWYTVPAGYDHGHLCPAADCRWDKDAMVQSFLLTNMCPQCADLNRGAWEYWEDRCRGWARHYGEIYIAAGPIFYKDTYQTMGDNKVGIPDAFYKVMLVMGKEPKSCGIIYPNHATDQPMWYYVKTVDEVEQITGIDFFHNLPDEIEEAVEAVARLK